MSISVDEILANATVYTDDDGKPIIKMTTCGHCGRSWNDAAGSALTPTPAGRCPYEYEHEYPTDHERLMDGLDDTIHTAESLTPTSPLIEDKIDMAVALLTVARDMADAEELAAQEERQGVMYPPQGL